MVSGIAFLGESIYLSGLFTAAGTDSTLSFLARWGAAVGMAEGHLSQNVVKVFPNPFHEQATVSFSKTEEAGVFRLFDVTGREVFSQVVGKGKTSIVLDNEGLVPGLYFYNLANNSSTVSGRIAVN